MSHAMRVTIGQFRVSSHTLEIEVGDPARVPTTERGMHFLTIPWGGGDRSIMYADAQHTRRFEGHTTPYSERSLAHLVE